MVMDSNQKTIKGAQSVYRVLNILEEVILCGDRMITPKELSVSLDIPVGHRPQAVDGTAPEKFRGL